MPQKSGPIGLFFRESRRARSPRFTGSTAAFSIAAAGIIVLWAVTGPIFHYSDTWQLVINTGTTIVTFLMVFLIQRSRGNGSRAVHPEAERDRRRDWRGEQPARRRRGPERGRAEGSLHHYFQRLTPRLSQKKDSEPEGVAFDRGSRRAARARKKRARAWESPGSSPAGGRRVVAPRRGGGEESWRPRSAAPVPGIPAAGRRARGAMRSRAQADGKEGPVRAPGAECSPFVAGRANPRPGRASGDDRTSARPDGSCRCERQRVRPLADSGDPRRRSGPSPARPRDCLHRGRGGAITVRNRSRRGGSRGTPERAERRPRNSRPRDSRSARIRGFGAKTRGRTSGFFEDHSVRSPEYARTQCRPGAEVLGRPHRIAHVQGNRAPEARRDRGRA